MDLVSEATVYRLLKAHDLITSPAYVVIKAAAPGFENFFIVNPTLAQAQASLPSP